MQNHSLLANVKYCDTVIKITNTRDTCNINS